MTLLADRQSHELECMRTSCRFIVTIGREGMVHLGEAVNPAIFHERKSRIAGVGIVLYRPKLVALESVCGMLLLTFSAICGQMAGALLRDDLKSPSITESDNGVPS